MLYLEQKFTIFGRIKDKKNLAYLNKKYDIGMSTMYNIKQHTNAIMESVSSMECEGGSSTQKVLKKSNNFNHDSCKVFKAFSKYKWR